MVKRIVVLAMLMGLLPSASYAQSARDAIRKVEAGLDGFQGSAQTDPPSQALVDWQRQYDQARAQKESGKRKILIGAAAAAGGVVLAVAGANSCLDNTFSGRTCTGSSAMVTMGWLANLGGSGVFIWGLVDFFDGNGEMNRLTTTKPTARAARASLILAEGQTLDVQVGSRSSVGYRLSW